MNSNACSKHVEDVDLDSTDLLIVLDLLYSTVFIIEILIQNWKKINILFNLPLHGVGITEIRVIL